MDVKYVSVTKTGKAAGRFKYFEIKYGSNAEELGERMGAGILYIGATRDEVKCVGAEVRSVKDEVKASRQDIQAMHSDMNTRFDTLDEKYGVIGKQMTRIVDHMVGEEQPKPKKRKSSRKLAE